jgi:hypothetical protein
VVAIAAAVTAAPTGVAHMHACLPLSSHHPAAAGAGATVVVAAPAEVAHMHTCPCHCVIPLLPVLVLLLGLHLCMPAHHHHHTILLLLLLLGLHTCMPARPCCHAIPLLLMLVLAFLLLLLLLLPLELCIWTPSAYMHTHLCPHCQCPLLTLLLHPHGPSLGWCLYQIHG